MKWLFRTILAILFGFVLCCGIGYFLPATQIVETHISVKAYPDEIYAELVDLRGYPAWFHGLDSVDAGQIVYAGAERGIGQSAAWRLLDENANKTANKTADKNIGFGNLEILQSQTDGFVTLRHEQGAQIISLTYAVLLEEAGAANEDAALLLARYEKPLGGFPYLSRLRGKLRSGGIAKDLDGSLQRLQNLIEATTTE